jgi:hypothetical protein
MRQEELASRLSAEAERRAVERRLREMETQARQRSLADMAAGSASQLSAAKASHAVRPGRSSPCRPMT